MPRPFLTRMELATLIKVANRTFDWEAYSALPDRDRRDHVYAGLMLRNFVVRGKLTEKGRKALENLDDIQIADKLIKDWR